MRRALLVVAIPLIASCHDPDAFTLGPDTIDSVLVVEVSTASLPADGIARATITARIDPRTDATKRTMSFTTSLGTLIGGGKEASTTTVNADATGTAIVELRSSTAPGTARVDVTVATVTRTTIIDFTASDPSRTIALELSATSVPADGVSPISLVARLAPGLTADRRRVTFRTTAGRFLPGNQDTSTIDADQSNVARTTLVGTVVGAAQVTAATADGISDDATVTFTTAFAESLFVSPVAATIRAGNTVRVDVTLLRSTGTATPRQQVTYSATRSDGTGIGAFSGVTLVENGASQATFNLPANETYLGPVTIRATVGVVSGTALIQVVP